MSYHEHDYCTLTFRDEEGRAYRSCRICGHRAYLKIHPSPWRTLLAKLQMRR